MLMNILKIIGKYGNDFNLINPIRFIVAESVVDKDIKLLINKYKDGNEKYNIIYDDGTIKGRFNVCD